MTINEQQTFLAGEYAEAMRYMDNAKEALQKAKKNDEGSYTDIKYVRTACGVAYSGVLVALDAWLTMKGVGNPKKTRRKSVDFYKAHISLLDKKLADYYNTVYSILHLYGYYDGVKKVNTIQDGFEDAYRIINKIKPENPVVVEESRMGGFKRKMNNLLISMAVMFR